MTDIVERLRATLLDRDNFPRMDSEKWLSVGLAKEAADLIERLRKRHGFQVAANRSLVEACVKSEDENERLRFDVSWWEGQYGLVQADNERLRELIASKGDYQKWNQN